jgi:hypothetical protein
VKSNARRANLPVDCSENYFVVFFSLKNDQRRWLYDIVASQKAVGQAQKQSLSGIECALRWFVWCLQRLSIVKPFHEQKEQNTECSLHASLAHVSVAKLILESTMFV